MSKPVLFASIRPLERSENLHAIYEAYPGDKVHIRTFDFEFKREVLSGKYDLMVIDDFPYVTPGKCIMIWHGIQGGKKIGLDHSGCRYYNTSNLDKMTHIISAGTGTVDMWHSATGMDPSRILPLGMPRTDAYHGKRKGDGHTFLADKRAYLYVPTFRDKGETPMPGLDFDYLDRELSDDEVFAIKAHPWQFYHGLINQIPTPAKLFKHIRFIHESEPSANYLYDADVVITDYSSIMFDAYILDKPVVLFEKIPGYTTTRGMYLEYPNQYCSRYATNDHELVQLMHEAAINGPGYIEYTCRNLVADMCDGHSCERLSQLINDLKGG